MKKVLLFTALLATCLLASCAHNASMLGAGTAFRIGSGEVSLHYADGLFLTNVSRENVRFTAELDSTMGFTYDPTTDTYKGIKGITYEDMLIVEDKIANKFAGCKATIYDGEGNKVVIGEDGKIDQVYAPGNDTTPIYPEA